MCVTQPVWLPLGPTIAQWTLPSLPKPRGACDSVHLSASATQPARKSYGNRRITYGCDAFTGRAMRSEIDPDERIGVRALCMRDVCLAQDLLHISKASCNTNMDEVGRLRAEVCRTRIQAGVSSQTAGYTWRLGVLE